MKHFAFLLIFCTLLYSQEDKIVINNVIISSSFSDFDEVYFNVDVTFHNVWSMAALRYDCEYYTGSSWERAEFRTFYEPQQLPIYTYEYYIEDVYISGISPFGNGDFRLNVNGYADEYYDSDGWYYFSVADVAAPATPTNVATSWSSNHPHLSWSANSEIDLQYYEVWKKRTPTGSWSLKATTTNTSYTDGSEIQFSSPPKETVYYKICAVDYEENKSAFTSEESFLVNAWQQNILAFTEISDIKLSDYQLFSNYPNPFNPDTKISFGLPEQSMVNLDVYDVSGKKVANLINGNQQAGMYTATFNAQHLPSGVYIYKMNAKGIENGKSFTDVRRMLLIK